MTQLEIDAAVAGATMKESPASMMVHGVLERILNPGSLNELFETTAEVQSTEYLLFSGSSAEFVGGLKRV